MIKVLKNNSYFVVLIVLYIAFTVLFLAKLEAL